MPKSFHSHKKNSKSLLTLYESKYLRPPLLAAPSHLALVMCTLTLIHFDGCIVPNTSSKHECEQFISIICICTDARQASKESKWGSLKMRVTRFVAPIDLFHSSMKQTLNQERERAFQVPLSRRSWVRRRRRRLQRRVANSSSSLLHRQALYVQPILPNEERLHLVISWVITTPKGQRLIDMSRSVILVPMNPRLVALLEHRRLEVTRERHEEESAKRQQQQQQQQSVKQRGAAQQHNMMMADGSRAVQEIPFFASFAALFLQQPHMNDCITRTC
eukprot:scaffold6843_cov97-Skeletonema_dohrnii-CCMP3373.AAC.2